MRGIAIGRKNWTIAGSDEGGRRAAAVYTLIETCKSNDVDPQARRHPCPIAGPSSEADRRIAPVGLEQGSSARACRRRLNICVRKSEIACGAHRMHTEYLTRRENIIAVGNSGAGKTHIGLGLGLAACQKGLSVGFNTASALVHELLEARDQKRLLRLQRQLPGYKLLIIDELGYVLSRRPAPSCCSRCSASVMSAVQPSSPQTCRLTNGPACSVPSGLRVRCSTGLPITSISWK